MEDPSILFVKPKAISHADKKALKSAGVIVVELDDPSNVKFIRAGAELNSTELLNVAMQAVSKSSGALDAFGRAMTSALLAKGPRPTSDQ